MLNILTCKALFKIVSILTIFKGLLDTNATTGTGQTSQTCHQWVTATAATLHVPSVPCELSACCTAIEA